MLYPRWILLHRTLKDLTCLLTTYEMCPSDMLCFLRLEIKMRRQQATSIRQFMQKFVTTPTSLYNPRQSQFIRQSFLTAVLPQILEWCSCSVFFYLLERCRWSIYHFSLLDLKSKFVTSIVFVVELFVAMNALKLQSFLADSSWHLGVDF